MKTNSQLSAIEPTPPHQKKKQKKKLTKQTIRIGTESQKWRSHGGLSAGKLQGRLGERIQGIRNINGRYKIDRG